MSTKTLRKRIALVAVSAMGFGLVSSVPAFAAAELPTAATITTAASTNIATSSTSGTWVTRTSFSSLTLGGAVTQTTAASGFTAYLIDSADAKLTTTGITAGSVTSGASTPVTVAGTATTGTIVFGDAATGEKHVSYSITVGDLAAGTYRLVFDADGTYTSGATSLIVGTIQVVAAGTPTSVTWTYPSVTEVNSSVVDYSATFNVKDASGVNTVLVNDERVNFDVTPQTGATATQVQMADNTATIDKADQVVAATLRYTTILSGDGSTPTAGTTIAGTTYTVSGTLQDGTSALASPVSTLYKRVANTSGLTGTIAFRNSGDTAGVSALSAAPSTAATVFRAKALDSNGGPIIGATISHSVSGSLGTFTNGSQSSGATGLVGSDITFTAGATAGTGTVTATILAGAISITNTLPVTVTAVGATAATNAGWSVVANNGSGLVAGTAPNWTAAPNTSSFTAKLSGLDANKNVKMILNNAQSATATANGIAKNNVFYVLADSAGVASVTLAATVFADTNTIRLQADGDNSGAYETELIITSAAAAGAITTSPAASSLNMATPSSTNAISASVADQFSNRILGGSVTITNTTVPAGVTAATTTTVMTSNGDATFNAVIGATLGQYVFSIQAKDPNGSNVGSASTVTYQVTATGIAGSLTLADSDSDPLTLTSDNKSTRAVVIAPAALTNALAANTDNTVDISVTTATPAALAFSATATNGIRLFTTDPKNAVIGAGKSTVTGTAGTTRIYAVPTLVGAGTITVTSGGLTQVFTLTGALAAAPKAQIVTLTAGANANGKAAYTVKTTDIFGNAVAADVNIAMSGNGYLSNGFKNMTVSTLATDGSNSFDVISDGTAASGVTATVVAGSFQAITATQATAQSLASASVQSATGSTTVVQREVPLKSAEVIAIEAIAAKAASDKAESDAKIALLQAALDAAATKAAADKVALEAAIAAAAAKAAADTAAAQAAAVAAAEAAADAAAEAIDAGNNAFDAATSAGEAADAATAAAEQAGEDATAAANAAGEAAVAAAEAAQEAAAEATDAANAATDAANASAEAADAATAAAQDAADAVAALSTQVSEMVSALKKQITALTNLVIKIQKKVKA
jgi:trimeric autotransporter adhesin